ncbi:hypothetical protein F4778DRAFT_799035 [Xylariomycetidae sp. FL2044]|nr:hypothetical protein F4778DRAFT_799035 [Xylariomycetidae sp. FL2044]
MGNNEPIAVIGSGCRFPGSASSPSKLWDLLSKPRDVLSEIPSSRFNPHGFYNKVGDTSGHSNVLHSYILDEDVRAWDADFFNISANEAAAIDPQQRLLMETVYEALEIGGQRINDLRGSDTAVYVGLMGEEYSSIQGRELDMMPTYHATGTARSIVSNRVSYFFDWHGASMTIDTACSSSLVAVHHGVQAIRSGASRIAVAAGTNLLLGPEPYIAESTFHMLSPRGRSHMWDAGADGYGRGDGVGAVVLKKLSDAIAAGDVIECVIRETGVNQDGRTNGITVPSPDAQVALIEDTYRRAGLDLSSPTDRPQFFEAHGTGTGAGDPLEAEAIHRSIGRRLSSNKGERLYVGSIKTVIGHTEGTAGIAGLMKVSLALQNRTIPPNMLFSRLNPAIEPFYGGLEVPVEAQEWPACPVMRASVNSFGFGGTNAHAIVERYEVSGASTRAVTKSGVAPCIGPYTFSAVSKTALKQVLKDTASFIEESPNISARDLAYTLSSRRSTFAYRAAYAGRDLQTLRKRILDSIGSTEWENQAVTHQPARATRILGIFTGQGAQWPGMGKQLLEEFPFVQARIRELEMALATLPASDRPSWLLGAELRADASKSKLHLAEYAQPLCTALQIILVDLLAAANVRFSAVVGHSSGEIGAAYAAGVISARDAIVIAYYRGVHTNLAKGADGQRGGMLAVGTSPEDAQDVLDLPQFEGRICVAACNSPTSVTLSGDADAVEEAKDVFEDERKFARLLRVDKAYHSHHMQPCTEPYVTSLLKAGVKAGRPQNGCKWYSSVDDGVKIVGDATEELGGRYWARNMAQTVLFSAAVERAFSEEQYTMAIEVGPHATLKGPATETMRSQSASVPVYIGCLARNTDSIETFTNAMGQIWANAADGALDLDKYQITAQGASGTEQSFLKNLPTYPWDNKRVFWNESRRSRAFRTRSEPGHPLLGLLTPESNETDMSWYQVLRLSSLPWLKGHQLQGQTVFPAAGYVALAVEAAKYLARTTTGSLRLIELEDFDIGRAIAFEREKAAVEMYFSLHIEKRTKMDGQQVVETSFFSRSATGEVIDAPLNASGRMTVTIAMDAALTPSETLPAQEEGHPSMTEVGDELFYSELKQLGYQYSGAFRALNSMTRKMDYGRGRLSKVPPSDMHDSEEYLLVHPGYLDAAFQAMFLAFSYPGDGRIWSLHVPVSIDRIRIDAARCQANTDKFLSFDSTINANENLSGKIGLSGDVDIFSGDGQEGLIQVENIRLIPFAPASEAQDTQMFYVNTWNTASPDGDLATGSSKVFQKDIDLGLLLERMSHFYLRRLVDTVKPEEEARAERHHQLLMRFARQSVDLLKSGRLRHGKKEWAHDTAESLEPLMSVFEDHVDVQLLRTVGEHLVQAVRGETDILEHMAQSDLLIRWHDESLGRREFTGFLAELVGQITHVHPHMRILELGGHTGGATKSIMNKISNAYSHYTFTDPSPESLEAARSQLSESHMRIAFQVLEPDTDLVAQGFQEHSFDMVIGSLAVHATTMDPESYMCSIRKLLKPGGYLVMLEVTAGESIRLPAMMGGLARRWWLATDDSLPPAAALPLVEWHSLLVRSGFSGVETSTPELDGLSRPYSVLVSRATNEHIDFLLEPSVSRSSYARINELIIVAGRSLIPARLAETTRRLLQPHCERVSIVQRVQDLAGLDVTRRPSVLYLADLDEPVFARYTPEAHDGLRKLWTRAQSVLWATRGARRDNPDAIMSLGLGRAMMVELAHSKLKAKFIDFDMKARLDAHMLADEVLRLQILTSLSREEKSGLVWSEEPELEIDAEGRAWVPRLVPHRAFNDCYNSSRRQILAHAEPAREVVEIFREPGQKQPSLIRVRAPEAPRTDDDFTRVRVLYSATTPLRTSSPQALYICAGVDTITDKPVVTLSRNIASIVDVPRSSVIPYGHSFAEAPFRVQAITTRVLSTLICSEASHQTTTALLDPPDDLAKCVIQLAAEQQLKITLVTTSPVQRDYPVVYISPSASSRAIRKILPVDIASIIDFTKIPSQGIAIAKKLQQRHGELVRVDRAESFRARNYSSEALYTLFQDAVDSAPSKFPQDKIVSADVWVSEPQLGASIVDWGSKDSLPVTVKPSDSLPILRGDRSYLLFGLAGSGGLGMPLAEYMVSLGARNIILTSRRPTDDKHLIAEYARQGVRIQMMANDITDETDVQNLVAEVRASWPPIGGVANGANVLNDMAFEDMSFDDMNKVLTPKVEGTRILDQIFYDEPLDFFIGFSSISIVLGRSGQSNYDTANIFMLGLVSQRRARGLNASVIDIGPISGVGLMARDVSENVMSLLVNHGYRKMSGRDFLTTFANGILAGRVHSGEPEELITGLTVHPKNGKFQPTWVDNPRFSHLMLNSDASSGSASEGSAQVESLETLLKKSRSPGDVSRVLRTAVLNKLQNILSLSDEVMNSPDTLLQQATSALGLDSLLAVELRTWMLGELGVDIPVLKILSDTAVQGLVDFAVENLPSAFVPNLDANAKDAITEESLTKPRASDEPQPPAPIQQPVLAPSIPPVANPELLLTPSSRFTVAETRAGSSVSSTADSSDDNLVTPDSSLSSSQIITKPSATDRTLPMSFGQSRFWVMQQIVEDPTAFNISCDVEISSEIDIPALKRAVKMVGNRHEALRTCFFNEENHQPMQGILKDSLLYLETRTASAAEVDTLFQEVHKTVYDLRIGRVMRAMLVSTSPTQHHLLVGYHHINMDSTSFVVFVSDMLKIYAGQILPPPRVQYSDFSHYQLESLSNGRWSSQIAYWVKEFARLPDPLPILNVSPNTTRPRPNLTIYKNRSVETRVSAKVARQFQSTCRKLRVTPFHLYTTILQITLARLAAIDDVCIGMADANRTDVGATDSIGNFLNLLPLRLQTDLKQSFSSMVKTTKNKVLNALSNSAVPFDVILEKVGVRRSSTHSPLFQAFIDYRFVTEKLPFGKGHLEGKRYIVSETPYDVMVEMIDTPTGEASLKLLVQEALYTLEQADIIMECFTNLLDAFTRENELKAEKPQMFSAVKVDQALQLGRGAFLDLKHASFLTEVDEIAVNQPSLIALRDSSGSSLSWGDMKSKSIAIGESLQKLRLPPQSRIGVFQEPGIDWVCSMLGAWRAAHTYVPLETTQGMRRLADVAKEAQLGALVIHDATIPLLPDLSLSEAVKVVNVSTLPFSHLKGVSFVSHVKAGDEAMIIYTSGSTGTPKGISIPHRVVVNGIHSFLKRWPMPPQTVLQQAPLSFDVSWWVALIGLGTKGSVVVAGPEACRDPTALTRLIVSKNITFTFAVPSESVSWLQSDAAALRTSGWSYHTSGGEPYSLNLINHLQMLDKPDLRAINIYGPTETMIPTAHEIQYRTVSSGDLPIPIGGIMPNYSVRVVDPQGHLVPAGIPGQLVFAGAGIADGYVGNPALTAERFPKDALPDPQFTNQGWNVVHHSGDHGYLRESDGVFVLQARINGDTQVKLRGLRIDMLDVEANILSTAKGQISDAVAHVRKPEANNSTSEFLMAHVILTKEARSRYATEADLRAFTTQVVKGLRVPDYMRPAMMVAVDSLPLTHHGKVDRKAVAQLPLAEVLETPEAETTGTASISLSSPSQGRMKELWLDVLGESVHAHSLDWDSDFFLIGGNSLLLIRVQGELRKRYGLDVPLTELFQRNTLAQMAALLSTKDQSSTLGGSGIDWVSEIKLQPNLTHLRATTLPQPKSGLVLALTGATGFLGLELVKHLVRLPEVKTVHALAVRDSKKLAQVSSSKLVIHPGDLSRPQFGMTQSAIAQVFSTSHAIIHNGADVSFLKAYGSVRPTNLVSTKDIVKFALHYGNVRHVHYVSTAGIATMLTNDLYEESIGSFPPASSPEGYVLTKWASELYLERASAATGLPITIHRPTAIVGENAPHLDVMSNILHFSRQMATVPSMSALEGSFQFVPVEDVAHGLVSAVLAVRQGDSGPATALVHYRNHNGRAEDTIDVHGLAPYLSRQLHKTVTVTPDAEWIAQAKAAGMADEVVEYMKGVNLGDRKGEKWTFPRALNGPRPL